MTIAKMTTVAIAAGCFFNARLLLSPGNCEGLRCLEKEAKITDCRQALTLNNIAMPLKNPTILNKGSDKSHVQLVPSGVPGTEDAYPKPSSS